MIKNSRYKIPSDTYFKQYKAPQATDVWQPAQSDAGRSLSNIDINKTVAPSEVEGYDLLFAKILFSVSKDDIEKYQDTVYGDDSDEENRP